MVKERPHYSFSVVDSYNATYNYIVGMRSIGKTFGATVKAIKKYVRKREQFIYLRRYDTELDTRQSFFDAIIAKGIFPEWDFRVTGYKGEIAPASTRGEKKRKWDVICFFIPLSKSQAYKSTPFPRVTTIIYDEFIIEKGAVPYLPSESERFDGFYLTVDRMEDRVKVYFLANSASIHNPYFIARRISPVKGKVLKYADGDIICHFPDGDEFKESIKGTKYFKRIKGTAYEKYAIDNEFADNNDNLIRKRPPSAKYHFTLETRAGRIAIWYDMGTNLYYAESKMPKKEVIYTIVPEWVNDGKRLFSLSDGLIKLLRTAYRHTRIGFDEPYTRNVFIEIMTR